MSARPLQAVAARSAVAERRRASPASPGGVAGFNRLNPFDRKIRIAHALAAILSCFP